MFDLSNKVLQQLFVEKLYIIPDYLESTTLETKDVVVLFRQEQPDLNSNHKLLLSKILQAVGYPLEKVQLLNVQHSSIHQFAHIQQTIAPKYVLAFGITSTQLGLNFQLPYYQGLPFQNCYLLLADPLTVVAQDINKKKVLWKNLKRMFSV